MAGEVPQLSPEIIDTAWRGVELTAEAFKDVEYTRNVSEALSVVSDSGILGVIINNKIFSKAEQAMEAAERKFDQVSDLVAPNFRKFGEANPFSFPQETAVSLGKAAVEFTPETRFKAALEAFLNPEIPMAVENQLGLNRELWGKLGYEMPRLTAMQKEKLAADIKADPTKRIVMTPLLGLAARKKVNEDARKFTNGQFSDQREALWTPDEGDIYGKLLRDPTATVKYTRHDTIIESFVLRYKSPEGGEPLTRAEFEAVLLKTGQGVSADSGATWVVALIDAGVETPRSRDNTSELYAAVNPIIVPEVEITTQLFHLANGTPNKNHHVSITNEAVYELGDDGKAVAPERVASVDWNVRDQQMVLRSWGMNFRAGGLGARDGKSGL